MVAKILFVSSSIAVAVLFIILQITNPASIHPVGLLGVFFLIYVVFVGLMTLVVFTTGQLTALLGRYLKASSVSRRKVSLQQAYLYGSLLALAPVILIGMQSVGSLGFVDVVLVIVFEAVICFYVWRRQ